MDELWASLMSYQEKIDCNISGAHCIRPSVHVHIHIRTRALIQYKDVILPVYRKSHRGDKTVIRSSYLHNGISYTGKISSLYWIRALDIIIVAADVLPPDGAWPSAGTDGSIELNMSSKSLMIPMDILCIWCIWNWLIRSGKNSWSFQDQNILRWMLLIQIQKTSAWPRLYRALPIFHIQFSPKTHERHPLARPLGRGMGCLLWIQIMIYILPYSLQCCMWCWVILDRDITALDCIFFRTWSMPKLLNPWCIVLPLFFVKTM